MRTFSQTSKASPRGCLPSSGTDTAAGEDKLSIADHTDLQCPVSGDGRVTCAEGGHSRRVFILSYCCILLTISESDIFA
ncbi:hypothetical protein PAL_GLEAN10020908 [Pteropus alecto]|uniref:Uncharacterized protein n=1 Tax=Pteropus alecto TaxID=9402 RepID=L5JQL0_PTEAL|nr:hypothetical protein PAL_GLEAN10020908 [Pteropus alecto]